MTAPAIRVERTVEWPDTDAAGHYHHSSVIRWVEAAEAELHLALGLPDLFGKVPRVRYEVDYLDRLWFRDRVSIDLRIASVGTTWCACSPTPTAAAASPGRTTWRPSCEARRPVTAACKRCVRPAS